MRTQEKPDGIIQRREDLEPQSSELERGWAYSALSLWDDKLHQANKKYSDTDHISVPLCFLLVSIREQLAHKDLLGKRSVKCEENTLFYSFEKMYIDNNFIETEGMDASVLIDL